MAPCSCSCGGCFGVVGVLLRDGCCSCCRGVSTGLWLALWLTGWDRSALMSSTIVLLSFLVKMSSVLLPLLPAAMLLASVLLCAGLV